MAVILSFIQHKYEAPDSTHVLRFEIIFVVDDPPGGDGEGYDILLWCARREHVIAHSLSDKRHHTGVCPARDNPRTCYEHKLRKERSKQETCVKQHKSKHLKVYF